MIFTWIAFISTIATWKKNDYGQDFASGGLLTETPCIGRPFELCINTCVGRVKRPIARTFPNISTVVRMCRMLSAHWTRRKQAYFEIWSLTLHSRSISSALNILELQIGIGKKKSDAIRCVGWRLFSNAPQEQILISFLELLGWTMCWLGFPVHLDFEAFVWPRSLWQQGKNTNEGNITTEASPSGHLFLVIYFLPTRTSGLWACTGRCMRSLLGSHQRLGDQGWEEKNK